MQGKVKRVTDRGFGFLEVAGYDKDIFFHASALVGGLQFNDLREGDMVTCEVVDGDKGLMATNVARA